MGEVYLRSSVFLKGRFGQSWFATNPWVLAGDLEPAETAAGCMSPASLSGAGMLASQTRTDQNMLINTKTAAGNADN